MGFGPPGHINIVWNYHISQHIWINISSIFDIFKHIILNIQVVRYGVKIVNTLFERYLMKAQVSLFQTEGCPVRIQGHSYTEMMCTHNGKSGQ